MREIRLCEILGVEVGERFEIYGAGGPYHVNATGGLVSEDDHFLAGSVMCYIINTPNAVIKKHKWTEKDKADARAVKELFQDEATIIQRGENYVYLRSPVETFVAFSKNTFPSLKEGEEMEVDEILGGEE